MSDRANVTGLMVMAVMLGTTVQACEMIMAESDKKPVRKVLSATATPSPTSVEMMDLEVALATVRMVSPQPDVVTSVAY